MTEAEGPPLCINAYIHSLAPVLYGMLKLLPEQVDELTFIDIDEMKRGVEEEMMRRRWETAYWVSIIIQPHVKESITADLLMRPFLPEKTGHEMLAEKEHLKKIFNLE